MTHAVTVEDKDGRRDLILSRPDRGNCLSEEMVSNLSQELDRAEHDGTRLLVLRGEGRNFCTGFDLSDIETVTDAQLLARFISIELLLARIWSAPFHTAVAAQGRVIGAGADLFASCSIRIAAAKTTFSFPGAGFGLILGTRRLGQRIGPDRAADLIRTGRQVPCNEALAAGLVTLTTEANSPSSVLNGLGAQSDHLDSITTSLMRSQLTCDTAALDGDLAALVRSAARPGLVNRIRTYRDRIIAKKARQ